ncbi:MAG: hypothetical protein EHM39_09935 [Chloroflexi bacterium]|nr:MAG: hypothetical protein EHM39_09935 [Chloroflexota bacterium]
MSMMLFIVFIILFVLLLMGLLTVADGRGRSGTRSSRRSRSQQEVETSRAALDAMRRAAYEGGEGYVEVSDIGLLAYRHSDEHKLIRYSKVLVDTNFLRPFIELWLPYQARGLVRFELVDSEGRLRYVDEAEYDLQPGDNVLLPSTWFPLRGKTIAPGQWRLQVMAGDTLLAVHPFGWEQVGGGEIQPYIGADGEISPALQQALRAKSRGSVSLSDLLADQEE